MNGIEEALVRQKVQMRVTGQLSSKQEETFPGILSLHLPRFFHTESSSCGESQAVQIEFGNRVGASVVPDNDIRNIWIEIGNIAMRIGDPLESDTSVKPKDGTLRLHQISIIRTHRGTLVLPHNERDRCSIRHEHYW